MAEDDALQLKKALRKQGVSMRCPACDWTLEGPLGEYVLTPRGDASEENVLGVRSPIPLVVFACTNCGYVRLHSANVIEEVVAHRLPPAGGQR